MVGVVLDEDEAASRAKVASDETEDRELVAAEVKRVRHHDPVERRQLERHREVGDERRDVGHRKRIAERPHLDLQGASVPVEGVDRAGRTEEVGEGEGERSFTRAEVGPGLPAPEDALPEQPDMVAVVHRVSLAHAGRAASDALPPGQVDRTGAGHRDTGDVASPAAASFPATPTPATAAAYC